MHTDSEGQEFFNMRSEQHEHAAHLHLGGEIDLATSRVIEEWLRQAESNGNTAIVLDLEKVTFMDSSGLNSFLQAAERAGARGRSFTLVKAPAAVSKILRLTNTTHLLGEDRIASNEPTNVATE
jgi:stage II sporulation protein AA (anti-sigma F factor antagonist)